MAEYPIPPTLAASTFEGVAFIRLAGEIDLHCADELRQLGEGVITDYVGTIRIDMSGVTFLDSTAIGALIAVGNKATQAACVLILEKPAPKIYRLFEITSLTDIFTIERA